MGNEQSSNLDKSSAKPGIVVVKKKENNKKNTDPVTQLSYCPTFDPLLVTSLTLPDTRPFTNDLISPLVARPCLKISVRFQKYLEVCSNKTQTRQQTLESKIKGVDKLSSAVVQHLTERQRKFAKHAEHSRKVVDIATTLNKIHVTLTHTLKVAEEVNLLLPSDLRLPPFKQNSGVENKGNKSIVSTVKYMLRRRDYTKKYTANNTITAVRAMQEYLVTPADLEGLQQIRVRSPYVGSSSPMLVYLEKDVIERAVEVWGSMESLEREQKRVKKLSQKELPQVVGGVRGGNRGVWKSGAGRVVAYAAAGNAAICCMKLVSFLQTGSASMFSETLHSLADTCNQLLLLWGVSESLKKADDEHPYGFGNMRHIMALISGVGIFCMGCGASVYHGVQLLIHPADVALTGVGTFGVLLGSAVVESISLVVALNETRKNARKDDITMYEYVRDSRDPSTNVVLLEDSAAVLGVAVAASALALTSMTSQPVYDAVGSILIGGLLGAVATFLVTTNVNVLIGRSIPAKRLEQLKEELEDDVVIRGVYDVKSTQLSADEFKFKAEIDFDGREITRAYLATVDMEQVMREIHSVKTLEELEQVISRYGEHVIDTLGVQVDRIESELKKKNPDLRHIDLEVL